jgi:3,5-epimerase/4-reductase
MKYLIYGNGWIGSMGISLLEAQNIDYSIGQIRVDNDLVEAEIESVKPSHIMCFIGRTHGEYEGSKIGTIDYLEKPGKLVDNIRDNLFSPLVLALICQRKNIHLTYLGTGCIFSQESAEIQSSDGYNENDNPDFFGSSYSVVKGFTDRLMHQFKDSVLNLRIRMPIVNYDNPRNFITKITKYDKICSIQNSMSYLPDLLPIALDMSINGRVGTINLTNPGTISHNEILDLYKQYVEPNFTWNNFNIEEQNQILLSKRSNNKLNTTKLESMYPNISNIQNALDKCLKNYNK